MLPRGKVSLEACTRKELNWGQSNPPGEELHLSSREKGPEDVRLGKDEKLQRGREREREGRSEGEREREKKKKEGSNSRILK